jgi:hypothetical protein
MRDVEWRARYLERVNMLAPLIIEKVERNGAERGSLAKCLGLLRVKDRTWIYCERPIDNGATGISVMSSSWSFLLSDPPMGSRAFSASCNLPKSDVLPDARYLDKLAAVAVDRGKRTLPVGFGSPLITRDELDRLFGGVVGGVAFRLDACGVNDSRLPWPIAVSFLIRPLDESFTLSEVYAIAEPLRRSFPNNRPVEAKIRQSLQILRDRGRIEFDGSGRYRKQLADVRSSVHLDFGEAARYTSRSQVARVAVEAWAASNVRCWRCEALL